MKNYKRPQSRKDIEDDRNDFAAILYGILEFRSYDGDSVTVADINKRLDDIVDTNENEGRKAVTKILQDLFLKMDAIQTKWLVRLILKSMKLGMATYNCTILKTDKNAINGRIDICYM